MTYIITLTLHTSSQPTNTFKDQSHRMVAVPSSPVIFLITGSSRGLGKAIATAAGKHHAKARFLLAARSTTGMEETKAELLASTTLQSKDILCRSMDLSNLDRLDSNADVLLQDLESLRHAFEQDHPQQHLIFVNNAANLGHLGPSWKTPSLEDMRHTIDFNVTSSLWLSVRFARYIHKLHQEEPNQSLKATLVNISSLAAVSQEFAGMGLYSAGKAAREMYHSLLAKDEDNPDSFKVLNFAPGPLETTMTEDIKHSSGLHETDLQSAFRQTQMLDPEESARKLIRLVEMDEFESGSHVDYFDLPDE